MSNRIPAEVWALILFFRVKFWVFTCKFDEDLADSSILVLEPDFSASSCVALSEGRAPDRTCNRSRAGLRAQLEQHRLGYDNVAPH